MVKQKTSTCQAKHTKFQMDIKTWCCPKCGATPDSNPEFFMSGMQKDADEKCDLTHPEDFLYCMNCDWSGSGQQWSNAMARKKKAELCLIQVPIKFFDAIRETVKTDAAAHKQLQKLTVSLLEKHAQGD